MHRGPAPAGPVRARQPSGARRASRRRISADLYARISPHLAHRPGSAAGARAHAWVIRRGGPRFASIVGSPVLVLRTVGRRSGQVREAPLCFARRGEQLAVVASNAASTRPPAWWLNLRERSDTEILLDGRWRAVRAREAGPEEAQAWWPALLEAYRGFEHYRAIATRRLPVIILDPRE